MDARLGDESGKPQKGVKRMELRHVAQRSGRLSSFLKGEMAMSTGLMNKLKWGDGICVNGVSQRTNYQVESGDVITVRLDEETPEYPAEDGQVDVIYEDEHILAVDKPAGMLIHPSHSVNRGTLANLVVGYYGRKGEKCAFHPVTRLDRDTYGIVLLAKNAHIHSLLNQLHGEGKLQKTYHAVVFGGPERNAGVIDAPIARRPLPSLLRFVSEEGKPSVTEFRVLERQGDISRLELKPITGRTHQLRLHCAWAGFPILGDPQYGSETSQGFAPELESQLLCAKKLEFCHPVTGEALCLVSGMDARY